MSAFRGRANQKTDKELPVPAGGVRASRVPREPRLNPSGTTGEAARRPPVIVLAVAAAAVLLVMNAIFVVADPTRAVDANSTRSTWAVDKASDAHAVAMSGPASPYSIVVAVVVAVLLLTGAVQAWRGDSGGKVLLSVLGLIGVLSALAQLVRGSLTGAGYAYLAVEAVVCAAMLWALYSTEGRGWFDARDAWLGRR